MVKSHISDKARIRIINKIKEKIKAIQKSPETGTVNKYNAAILGIMKHIIINAAATIKSGACAGSTGKVVTYNAKTDEVDLVVDEITSIKTISDNIDQIVLDGQINFL